MSSDNRENNKKSEKIVIKKTVTDTATGKEHVVTYNDGTKDTFSESNTVHSAMW